MIPLVELSHPMFRDEEGARNYLERTRWPNGPICPHCGVADGKAKPLGGESMGPGWYHCGSCRKKFTVRVGTVYERSHIALHKWLLGFRLHASSRKGFGANQHHRNLGITYRSAWFMAQRIREAMRDDSPATAGGKNKVAEPGETFIGPPDAVFINSKGWQRIRGSTA